MHLHIMCPLSAASLHPLRRVDQPARRRRTRPRSCSPPPSRRRRARVCAREDPFLRPRVDLVRRARLGEEIPPLPPDPHERDERRRAADARVDLPPSGDVARHDASADTPLERLDGVCVDSGTQARVIGVAGDGCAVRPAHAQGVKRCSRPPSQRRRSGRKERGLVSSLPAARPELGQHAISAQSRRNLGEISASPPPRGTSRQCRSCPQGRAAPAALLGPWPPASTQASAAPPPCKPPLQSACCLRCEQRTRPAAAAR